MDQLRLRAFREDDRSDLIALWEQCDLTRPWNDPSRDIDRKLARDPEHLLVAEGAEGGLIGSIMIGYEGHRGWVNYLAVRPDHQGTGLGRRLMAEAETRLAALGCPKVNLQVRATNTGAIGFYERLGYAVDQAVSMGKRLEHDDR
jgi:ribosomal protein S18 acetylase RimI-like enzyme